MAGTNKPNLDQNWKTSKPGTLNHGFTNSPEFNEAYRYKLLKSLMKLKKICLNRIILMNESGMKNRNPSGSAFFPAVAEKNYHYIYIYSSGPVYVYMGDPR